MIIDILVRIYDNLGDMGFAYELMTHLRSQLGKGVTFRLYTDDVETL